MKRIYTIFFALLSIGGFSQDVTVRNVLLQDTYMYPIPAVFTTNGKGQACLYDEEFGYSGRSVEINIYDETFTKIRTFSVPSETAHFYFEDYNTGDDELSSIFFTQTLFNDDDEYEYLVPIKVKNTNSWYDTVGFRILSSNGEELSCIEFGDGLSGSTYENSLLHIGDNYFLKFRLSNSDGDSFLAIYAIDKTATGVKQVLKKKVLSITPTIVNSSEKVNINVEGMARERVISVVSTNGGLAKQIAIPAGQSSVSLDTTGMSPGMYIVNVFDGKREYESCKMIVR